MNIFKKALFYISVPKCVACGEILRIDETAICTKCLEEYKNHKLRSCSSCAKVLSKCTCSNDYLHSHSVKRLVKLFRYIKRDEDSDMPSNMLVYSLKRDNREDVLSFLSSELSEAINEDIAPSYDGWVITSVPRRASAVRKYGIDHAMLLAKAVARRLNLPYARILKSTAKSPQKKMQDVERIKNATFAYLRNIPDIKGKRVIIVDDIVTTGASLGACAMLIRALGAKETVGAALSIAYKDKSIEFERGVKW